MKNDNDKESDLNNPHDSGFRDFFSERRVAQSFLRENLPASIAKQLDYRTLKISKDTFIDKQLIPSQSDLLYEIKYKNLPLLLYLLFEHKSYQDWLVAFQLLKYMVRIWELYLKQHEGAKKLPAILPLVIYHGKSEWRISKRFGDLMDIPVELEPHIPDFDYRLYDISHLPDEEIKGTVLLRIILMTFKYIYSPDLRHHLVDIFKLFGEIKNKTKGLEYLEALLRYLTASADTITPEVLQESLAQSIKDGGDIMPTIAQQWMQQGRQEGMESKEWFVVKNSLLMGLSIETIAKLTGLPVKRIEQMKTQLDPGTK